MGLRKPLGKHLGGLEQFDLFIYLFLGGRVFWVVGKFISGFVNDFKRWSLSVLLMILYVFLLMGGAIINKWF